MKLLILSFALLLTIASSAQLPEYRLVVIPIDSGWYKVHFTLSESHDKCDHSIHGRIWWNGKRWRWSTNEMRDKGYHIACVDYTGRREEYFLINNKTKSILARYQESGKTYMQCEALMVKKLNHAADHIWISHNSNTIK